MIGESITFKGSYATTGSGKNTVTDWHLIPLTKIMVNPPQFKSNFVNAEGMSGEIDLSTISGLNYSNRKGTWQFKLTPGYDFDTIRNEMIDYLHGGLMVVTLSSETDGCYYEGRITIEGWRSSDTGEYITIGYNLKPFRYDPSTQINNYSFLLSSTSGLSRTVEIKLDRMPAVPFITVSSISGTLTISYTPCNETGTGGVVNKTVTTTGNVDTSDMVYCTAPGGAGNADQRAGVSNITFTATGSTRISMSYIGGRF